MCVIYKRAAENNVLGVNVLSGSPESIAQSPYNYVAAEMTVPEQTKNMFSQASVHTQSSDELLSVAYQEISKLQQEKLTLTTQFYDSTKKYYDATVTIQELEHQINQLKQSNTHINAGQIS
jgi:hypothetical protein